MRRIVFTALLAALTACAQNATNGHGTPMWTTVTDERLRNAASDPGWLMYLRTYDGQGHSPLAQITTANVSKLHVVFTHSVSIPEGYEAPPIVNGRTMIVTTPMDRMYALDAVTGKKLWEFDHDQDIPKVALRTVCCDMVNRGVALYGNNAYMATLDNHVIAVDARNGKVVWDKTMNPPGVGYAMTGAPLAVHGKIIIGDGGGEYGSRGVIFALDAKTGNEVWRFYTVPSRNEPGGNTWPNDTYLHGGADPWVTGSYDVQTNTLLWGTGNPSPWLWLQHPGQNLYSDSLVALDPDTGKLKWYFQETPNDPWDYDAAATWVQADVPIKGVTRKIVYEFSRNGWLYVLDRTNGDLIYMRRYVTATSVLGYDRAHHIGIVDEALKPRIGQAIFTCPAFFGGNNWWSFTYDPQLHYAITPGMRTCMTLAGQQPPKAFNAGAFQTNEAFKVMPDPKAYGFGALQAYDLTTGKRVWHYETKMPWTDGTLSTDGGLVFSGTPDQKFYAFDAKTGKVLWVFHARSGFVGQPMSYEVDGKQYIAVQSGYGGVAPFWGQAKVAPMFKHIPLGGTLYVFSL